MLKAVFNSNLSLDYAGEEAMNTVCTNLSFAGRNIRRVVVTSCEANDGKSFLTLQMVRNLAKRGKKILLVDGDLRKSVMNSVYDVQLEGDGKGLAHYLAGHCTVEECVYETNINNVYLLPVGKAVSNPLSLIATPEFEHLMKQLGEDYDMVIVDAAPIGMVVDAAEIARCCDGSVMVLEYNKTHKKELNQAKHQMQQSGCPILGCILNKVVFDRLSTRKYYSKYSSRYSYKYGYGKYGYYGQNEKDKKK